MDEFKLRCFLGVALHKSFSRAAKELHVVQPTISRQIALLEEELGAQLFLRDTHSVKLTTAGKRLLEHANAYITQLHKLDENARNLMLHNECRVYAAVGSYEFPLASRAARQFQQIARELDFRPLVNPYTRNAAKTKAGTYDLFFGIRSCMLQLHGFDTASLGTYEWKLTARRDHPFWQLPREEQALLKGQTVVASSAGDIDPVQDYLKTHALAYQGLSVARGFTSVCIQVQLGNAVALLPEYLEPWLPPELRMESVLSEPLMVESVLFFNPQSYSDTYRRFFDYIRDHFRP